MKVSTVALISRLTKRGSFFLKKIPFSTTYVLNSTSFSFSLISFLIIVSKKKFPFVNSFYFTKTGEILGVLGALIGSGCDIMDGTFKWYCPFI